MMNHWKRGLGRRWIRFTIQQAGERGGVAGEGRLRTGKEKLQSKPTASSEPQRKKEEERSERVCKKKTHPHEKESRKCEAYRFSVAYKVGREKDEETNVWGRSPVLLVRGHEGPTIGG